MAAGVLETAATTFLLLIALRWFEAGSSAKALISIGGSLGLLLSPVAVFYVERLRWPTAIAASRIALLGGVSFLGMTIFPSLEVFTIGSVIGMATSSAIIPLLTQIYQDNYPAATRGKLFSRTMVLRIAATILFSEIAGRWLTQDLTQFRWVLAIFSAAFFVAAYCLFQCPSRILEPSGASHPFRAMKYISEDRLFRQTLLCWMLMGFANLMMLPLRVEYLANPKYNVTLAVSQIALFTGIIPNAARLLLSPLWGWLFDRMNFFALRMTLNVGFALGILAFFTTTSFWGLLAGSLLHGISNAGGDVAWSLWVTKFAPKDKVADYMSVHTFLTGVRGVIAPIVGFHALNSISLPTLGLLNALLIIAATMILLPELKNAPKSKQTIDSALVE